MWVSSVREMPGSTPVEAFTVAGSVMRGVRPERVST